MSAFFASCPDGSAPAIAGLPALNVTTGAPAIGSSLQVTATNASAVQSGGTVYCGFAQGLGAAFSTWTDGSCDVPTQNITQGPAYVFLTSGPSVSDASVLAGPAALDFSAQNVSFGTTGGSSGGNSSSGGSSGSGSGSSGSGSGSSGSSGMSGAVSGASIVQVSSALAFVGGALALLF